MRHMMEVSAKCISNYITNQSLDANRDLLTSAKVIKNGKMENVIQNWVCCGKCSKEHTRTPLIASGKFGLQYWSWRC